MPGGLALIVIRLQCGHGHEAVENMVEEYLKFEALSLQCGHGHEAVENSARRWEDRRRTAASMRPRP